MTAASTFGRFPTLVEMKEYYARDDVLSFLYDECRMRNVEIAYNRKRWPIRPTSKNHLSLFSTPVKILLDRFNTGSSFLNAIIFGSKTAIYGCFGFRKGRKPSIQSC